MRWFWIIPVVLCGFGIAVIVYGIRYQKEEMEHKKRYDANYKGGRVSETFFGALVEFIFVTCTNKFVGLFPKWFIKFFIFVIGAGFLTLGVYFFQDMPRRF